MTGNRKTTRLKTWDYSSPGAYHATFCTSGFTQTLSMVVEQHDDAELPTFQISLKPLGRFCDEAIRLVSEHFPSVTVPAYVVMPNHVHMLVLISNEPGTPKLGSVIGFVKAFVTRRAREEGAAESVWHRGFYEHIIRGDRDFDATVKYITDNPSKWAEDRFYRP